MGESWSALLRGKELRFVFAIIEGASQVEAYKRAGYKFSSQAVAQNRASDLVGKPGVKAALASARRDLVARVEVTVDTIIERLEAARQLAMTVDPPQLSAAVAATLGQAKVLGLVIDRSEVSITRNKPSLFPTKALELSEDEWRRSFDPTFALTDQRPTRDTRNDR